jgi:hypothetical protein
MLTVAGQEASMMHGFFAYLTYTKWDMSFVHRIIIQGVSEIRPLILTSNRTHQKEQLFSLPFWRKTLRSGLKK